MTGTPPVDWAAVERRARRLDLLVVPVLACWFVSWAALTDGFGLFTGPGTWWAVAGYLALFVVLLVLQRTVPRMRRNTVLGHRIQYGLQHLVDPGPGAREKADVYARRQSRLGWVVRTWVLLPLGVLVNGRWERPSIAVPAALVFLALTAAAVLQVRRQVSRAQRWVADPPGPPREVPPPTAVDRWTSGRRLVLASVGIGLVGGVAGVLIGLLG